MPSKEAKRNRAGGVKKENGTTAGSTDEIVKTAEAQRTDALKQRTASSSSALRSNEDDGIVAARTEDDEESDHGNAPEAEAHHASPSPKIGNVSAEVFFQEKEDRTRNAVLEAQLQAAEEDASRCQEQRKSAEAKMAEAQCRMTELEVQLQEAKDEVAVLQEFRQSRYEGETIKSKRSSRRSFGAAKALHCISRNRPDAVTSSKEKPASDSVGVTVGYIMTATPFAKPSCSGCSSEDSSSSRANG